MENGFFSFDIGICIVIIVGVIGYFINQTGKIIVSKNRNAKIITNHYTIKEKETIKVIGSNILVVHFVITNPEDRTLSLASGKFEITSNDNIVKELFPVKPNSENIVFAYNDKGHRMFLTEDYSINNNTIHIASNSIKSIMLLFPTEMSDFSNISKIFLSFETSQKRLLYPMCGTKKIEIILKKNELLNFTTLTFEEREELRNQFENE